MSSWCVLHCYTPSWWVIIWVYGNTFISSVSFHCKYLLLLISRAKTTVVENSASGWSLFPEESYEVWCVGVWSWSLANEDNLAHPGLLHHGEKRNMLQAFESGNDHSVINKLFSLTFICPCIASSLYLYSTTKKMQRFLDLFISINCSTSFRRFLRPSSGAQNCTYSVKYCQTNTAACSYCGLDGRCMYSFVLLMMGGGTTWNMQSNL